MDKKSTSSALLCAIAALLAVVAALVYRSVLYRLEPVYILLLAAAVLGCLRFALAKRLPLVSAYLPICVAALLASAAVWGSNLMVNQIGYVYVGLDPVSTILGWIWFMALTVVGMILAIVAAFGNVSPKAA